MNELKAKEYKRKNYNEYDSSVDIVSDSSDVFDIVIESLERHKTRPPVYSNDPEGFEKFKEMTISFIKEVRQRNIEAENSKRMRLIPSVEMWSTYLGITRQTINNYEHLYHSYYKDFIQQFKNSIAAIKKELAENGKINPMLHCFDFCNNYGYLNTNVFQITTDSASKESIYALPSERLERIKERYKPINESSDTEKIVIDDLPFTETEKGEES